MIDDDEDDVRSHLTEGVNRERILLEMRRAVRPVVVVAAGFVFGIAILGYIIGHVSPTLVSKNNVVRFEVADATGVVPQQNQVRINGVVVGTITGLDISRQRPVLTAKIDKDYGPIYRDVRAELRPNTPLQDMYLNITDRGSQAAGVVGDDDVISSSQTDTSVNIDDVLNIFQGDERRHLVTVLDQLGNGLDGRGDRLRALLAQLQPFLEVAHRATEQLDARRPIVKRLVHNAGILTQELAASQNQLERAVGASSDVVGTLADGRDDLAATLQNLPPAIVSAQSSFAAVRGIVDDVDEALITLRPVTAKLPSALADLERLGRTADPAVQALQEPVARLRPLVGALRPLSQELSTTFRDLLPQTDTIDHTTKDLDDCKLGIQRFFQWNASFTKFGDARAPSPRGNVVLGLQSTGLTSSPLEQAYQSCTAGNAITGRPARPEDGH